MTRRYEVEIQLGATDESHIIRTIEYWDIVYFRGDWIKKNSSYEPFICSILAMEYDAKLYWDVRWNGIFIEFKKGTSIWLDLVRYGEILLHRVEIRGLCSFFVKGYRNYTGRNPKTDEENSEAKTLQE